MDLQLLQKHTVCDGENLRVPPPHWEKKETVNRQDIKQENLQMKRIHTT